MSIETPVDVLLIHAHRGGLRLVVKNGQLLMAGRRSLAPLAAQIRAREAEVIEHLADACPRCYAAYHLDESRRRGCCTTCWLFDQRRERAA